MEWVETTGRTVAEALDAALDQLGVDEEETEYEVVDEPQKGLFGRLRVEARVRARVRPVRPRPKAERRERRRRGERNDRGDRGGRGRGGTGSTATRARGGGSRERSGRGNGNGARAAASGAGGAGQGRNGTTGATTNRPAAQAAEAGEGASKKSRRRRGGRGRGGGQAKQQQGAVVVNESSQVTEEARPALDLDEQRAAVEEFLEGLVEAFGRPEATVSVVAVDETTLEADVRGDELGLLVGPKGQTLQAVHELVRSMVQRRFVGQSHARVRVDVAGYRERRKAALERFTLSLAEEVRSSGQPKQLDPMMASDRKVIHDVVNDLDGVITVSQGEEPARRVIIRPS